MTDLEEENARLKAEVESLRSYHIHLIADYEVLLSHVMRHLNSDIEMLESAQIALSRTPPKVHVMVDHANRVIHVMKKLRDKIRERRNREIL